MNRIVYTFVVGLWLSLPLWCQVAGGVPRNAINYAYGVTSTSPSALVIDIGNTATGSATVTLSSGVFTALDGTVVTPLNTTSPVTVGSFSHTETVVPTSVNCVTPAIHDTCKFTAVFAYTHRFGDTISSASFGLSEAITVASVLGGQVSIDGVWSQAGGLTSTVTSTSGFTNVTVLDWRGQAGATSYSSASNGAAMIAASGSSSSISGTSVPASSAANQALVTTSTGVGAWLLLPTCPDTGGNHLNFIGTSPWFVCGTTGGTAGSVVFSGVGAGSNPNALVMTGSLDVSGDGYINANHLMGITLSTITGLTQMTAGVPSAANASNVETALGFTPMNGANNLAEISNAVVARSSLGLVIGTNVPSLTGTGTSGTWPISITGVPGAHAASHQFGGFDPVGTATPTANAIPQAGSGGLLALGWLPTIPYSQLSGTPTALPPSGTAAGDLSGSFPSPVVAKVNGLVVPVSSDVAGTNSSGQIVHFAYTAPSTGAVAQTQSTKNAQSFNILDFGADVTGATDSSAAFLAAVTACNGKLVIAPNPPNQGYTVTTPIAAWGSSPCYVEMQMGSVMNTGWPIGDSTHQVTYQSSQSITPQGASAVTASTVTLSSSPSVDVLGTSASGLVGQYQYTAAGGGVPESQTARNGQVISVKDYGAVGNGVRGWASVTGTALNCASCTFTVADVGKAMAIFGTGTGGIEQTNTISAFVDAHDITLGTSAVVNATFVAIHYGTDDAAAIQKATTAAFPGGTVFFPTGTYFVNSVNTAAGNSCVTQSNWNNRPDGGPGVLFAGNNATMIVGPALTGTDIIFCLNNTGGVFPAVGSGGLTYESYATQYQINVAHRGDTTVTLTTPSNASNFAPNHLIYMQGEVHDHTDQGTRTVTSLNASTGVLTLNAPLEKSFGTSINTAAYVSGVTFPGSGNCTFTFATPTGGAAAVYTSSAATQPVMAISGEQDGFGYTSAPTTAVVTGTGCSSTTVVVSTTLDTPMIADVQQYTGFHYAIENLNIYPGPSIFYGGAQISDFRTTHVNIWTNNAGSTGEPFLSNYMNGMKVESSNITANTGSLIDYGARACTNCLAENNVLTLILSLTGTSPLGNIVNVGEGAEHNLIHHNIMTSPGNPSAQQNGVDMSTSLDSVVDDNIVIIGTSLSGSSSAIMTASGIGQTFSPRVSNNTIATGTNPAITLGAADMATAFSNNIVLFAESSGYSVPGRGPANISGGSVVMQQVSGSNGVLIQGSNGESTHVSDITIVGNGLCAAAVEVTDPGSQQAVDPTITGIVETGCTKTIYFVNPANNALRLVRNNQGVADYGPVNYVVGTGTAQAQTAAYVPTLNPTSQGPGLQIGTTYTWLPVLANSGPGTTWNANGIGAKTIVKAPNNTALILGDLSASEIAIGVWDGTYLQLLNPQSVAAAASTVGLVSMSQEQLPACDVLCAHGGDSSIVISNTVQQAYVPAGAPGGTGYTNGDTWAGTGGTCTIPPAGTLTVVSGAVTALAFNTFTVTAASWTNGVATFTIGTNSLSSSQLISVTGALPAMYNGVFSASAETGTTISVPMPSNPGTWVSGGTVTALGTCSVFPTGISQGAGTGTGVVVKFSSCNNMVDDTSASTLFNTVYSVPASTLVAGNRFSISTSFNFWSSSTAETWHSPPTLWFSNLQLVNRTATPAIPASITAWSWQTKYNATAITVGSSSLMRGDMAFDGMPGLAAGVYNATGTRGGVNTTLLSTYNIEQYYNTHGVGSAVCNDAGNACGLTGLGSNAAGTTVNLQTFNGTSCSGVLATVYLTGTGAIANGTPIQITNTGQGCTTVGTTAAYVAGGTATGVSGTATVTPVLGGAQGNITALLEFVTIKEQ